ncbi:hypothetical protein MLD38_018047 [Melastoma candidum]|uniref:Uncharacterized protein n=1 Tax=Melastoma candidum TaxID=119954 RepID=A0ACB9QSM3_9MYRT|nr:hypothetical protein MLD38_018047 [Melastoma candidum]
MNVETLVDLLHVSIGDTPPKQSDTHREFRVVLPAQTPCVGTFPGLKGLFCLLSLLHMAWVTRPMALQTSVILSENALECSSGALVRCVVSASCSIPGWRNSPRTRRQGLKVLFALNAEGLPGNNGEQGLNGDEDTDLNGTRLGRIVSAGGRQLLQKLNSARRNFPMKIFLLLLGFYTANALATILGQTGDWDVLVAGLVVAAIEGIGMLMYRRRGSVAGSRLRSFVTMMNFWKAGVILGLFVDAFKLGS